MPVTSSFGRSLALTLGAGALACSAQVDEDHATTDAGSTRAVITVTRSAQAAAPEDARADAFAGFLRTPANADPKTSLAVAGLGLDLPAAGECRKGARGETSAAAPALTRLELLDAGEVTLAAGGSVTTLAPRAFPTITDSIAGVVYTTRDRAAAPLPAASTYTVATTGGSSLAALSGEVQAPALLKSVDLAGEPLSTAEALAAHKDLDVTWAAGSAGDHVYVELEASGDSHLCTFLDEAGHGVIPATLVPGPGSATVTVHRVREALFADQAVARGSVRFDFELSASVTFE
jgi:hypothetical protein